MKFILKVPELIYTKPSVFVKEVFSGKLNLNSQTKNLAVEIADKIQDLGTFFSLKVLLKEEILKPLLLAQFISLYYF